MTDLRVTKVFEWNRRATKRYVINQGGSRSGKTYAILQVLLLKARQSQNPRLKITVTAETLPALKKGALNDFKDIIVNAPFNTWIEKYVQGPDVFTLVNGPTIEFVPFPTVHAATHGRRDHLFMNEANHLPYEIAKQLMMRTEEQVFIDFNPTFDYWAHEKYLAREDAQWIFSTYRDNAFAPVHMIQEIEDYRIDSPEHYKVYGLGKRGALSGQVFPNFTYVQDFPIYASNVTYGMDIGFTNSPTTLVKLGQADGFIYGKELLYEHRLTEPEIVSRLDELRIPKSARIMVDSAAPMVIEYLRRYGDYNAIACAKKDVKGEIQAMKRYKWRITDDSINWKKEIRNYLYKKDSNGGLLNEPIKAWDHANDAARYSFLDMVGGVDGNFFFQKR